MTLKELVAGTIGLGVAACVMTTSGYLGIKAYEYNQEQKGLAGLINEKTDPPGIVNKIATKIDYWVSTPEEQEEKDITKLLYAVGGALAGLTLYGIGNECREDSIVARYEKENKESL